jgi:tetratricopeptide (TPR) repeat protein
MVTSRGGTGWWLVAGLLAGCAEEAPTTKQAAPVSVEQSLAEAPTELPCAEACPIREWVAEERYEEAREALKRELRTKPGNLETVLKLTTVDILDEEYEAAHVRASDHLSQAPEKVRLLERRALASLLGHDVETAREDYLELLEELDVDEVASGGAICDPLHGHCASPARFAGQAWVGLATAEYNLGDLAKAEQIARDLLGNREGIQVDPAFPSFVLALAASKRGDDQTALGLYQEVLKRFPNSAGALNNVGGIHYRQNDLQTARKYCTAAFEHSGNYRRGAAIAWANVGEIDMLEGDYEASEDKLLEALAITKRFAFGHFMLAVLYDILGRNGESMTQMGTALELDANGVERWNMSWINEGWKMHFDALVAEREHRYQDAIGLWQALAGFREKALAETAKRHLETRSALLRGEIALLK